MLSFAVVSLVMAFVVVAFMIGRKLRNEEDVAKEQWGDLFKTMMVGKDEDDCKGKPFWKMVAFWKKD